MPTIRAVLIGADGVVQLPGSAWSGSPAEILDLVRSFRSSGVSVSLATNQQAHRLRATDQSAASDVNQPIRCAAFLGMIIDREALCA